jgi:hypothetical protein
VQFLARRHRQANPPRSAGGNAAAQKQGNCGPWAQLNDPSPLNIRKSVTHFRNFFLHRHENPLAGAKNGHNG